MDTHNLSSATTLKKPSFGDTTLILKSGQPVAYPLPNNEPQLQQLNNWSCGGCNRYVHQVSLLHEPKNKPGGALGGGNCGQPICGKCYTDRSVTLCKKCNVQFTKAPSEELEIRQLDLKKIKGEMQILPQSDVIKEQHDTQNKVVGYIQCFIRPEQSLPRCPDKRKILMADSHSTSSELTMDQRSGDEVTESTSATAEEACQNKVAKLAINLEPEFSYDIKHLARKISQTFKSDNSNARLFFLLCKIKAVDFEKKVHSHYQIKLIAYKELIDEVIKKYKAKNTSNKYMVTDIVKKLELAEYNELAAELKKGDKNNLAFGLSETNNDSWVFEIHEKYLKDLSPHIKKFKDFAAQNAHNEEQIISDLYEEVVRGDNDDILRFLIFLGVNNQDKIRQIFEEFLELSKLWLEHYETIAEHYKEFEEILKENQFIEQTDDRFSETLKNKEFDFKEATYGVFLSLYNEKIIDLGEVLRKFSESHPISHSLNLEEFNFKEPMPKEKRITDHEVSNKYAQTVAEHHDTFVKFLLDHNLLGKVDFLNSVNMCREKHERECKDRNPHGFQFAPTPKKTTHDFYMEAATSLLRDLRDAHQSKYKFPLRGILDKFCQDNPTDQPFNMAKFNFKAMPRKNQQMTKSDFSFKYAQEVAENHDAFVKFLVDHNLMKKVDFLNFVKTSRDEYKRECKICDPIGFGGFHAPNKKETHNFYREAAISLLQNLWIAYQSKHGFPLTGILDKFCQDNPKGQPVDLTRFHFKEKAPRENSIITNDEISKDYAQTISENYQDFKVFLESHNLMSDVSTLFQAHLKNRSDAANNEYDSRRSSIFGGGGFSFGGGFGSSVSSPAPRKSGAVIYKEAIELLVQSLRDNYQDNYGFPLRWVLRKFKSELNSGS